MSIRGLIGKQILFTTKQELEVANIQQFVQQKAQQLSPSRKDGAEVLEKRPDHKNPLGERHVRDGLREVKAEAHAAREEGSRFLSDVESVGRKIASR